ncbi:TonB-dependent receptor [Flavisolibacter sp. BT320]|nr:TonB-dependent receptor [Flavisolibacter longurius]
MRTMIFLLLTIGAFSFVAIAQNRTITGRVTDEGGTGLSGASVLVRGTNIGVATDQDGNFSIAVPPGATVLQVSYSGLGEKEISLTNATNYTIQLSATANTLNEVVVAVAYGEQERRRLTGSVGKVSARQVENVPMASVDQILQGKVAGLQSLPVSGQPGAAQQIRIRGIGSISASSAPLFVIDGIPVNSGDASNLTNSSNLLATLNPNDIESISVLKDASAASIYGSRAANGVIIINTKKGRPGKTRIRVDAEFGRNDIAYQPARGKPLNRQEAFDLYTEGLLNLGLNQATVDFYMNEVLGYKNDANHDWMDLVTRKGLQQQVNVSASGGDPKTQFYLSGGYFKQQSPVIGSELTRYSVTTNLKHQVSNIVGVGVNFNLSSFNQMGESESANFRNPMLAGIGLLPTMPAYNPDGSVNYDPTVFNQIFNPLAIRQYDKQQNQTSKLLGSAFLEIKPVQNLKLTSRFGLDYNNIEEYSYYNPIFGDFAAEKGLSANSYNRLYNWVWTNFGDYNFRTFDDKIDGSITLGYEAQQSKTSLHSGVGNVLPANSSIVYPVPAVPTTASLSGSDYSFTSVFSRAQFNFLNRYSLSGSLRRDASSRFGSNNRNGTFWSVGAAWNIDQEEFFSNSGILSALKLRASYGVNGNAGIGNYDWRSVFSFSTTYNGEPGSFQNSIGNNNLTWEQNKPFDVGLEIGVLDNRISLEADYYIRKTENLLLNEPLSATGGFTTYSNNVGAMENKGFEFTLNATPMSSRNFSWNIILNTAFNKNKVTRLREGVDEIIGNPFTLRVGEDVQSYYLRHWAGSDPETGDPLWYKDGSKKGTTNDFSQAARELVGSASPKSFGGISTSLRYKSITLDAQLNYQYGNYVFNQWDFVFISDGVYFGLNQNRAALERWQKPGDITSVPRFEIGNATASNEFSTRYLYKGDFLRLRNLTLAFELPANLAQKARLTGARLYVRGTNLWTKTFDKNLTMDPEQPVSGLSDLQFFNPKSYTVGLSIQL